MVIKFFKKVRSALGKTRSIFGKKLTSLFQNGPLNENALENLEQLLFEADLGVQTATELTEKVSDYQKEHPQATAQELMQLIKDELLAILNTTEEFSLQQQGPTVIMVVGVNGNGKTTSIAKLGRLLQKEGKSLLFGAADTFRAAAMDQLQMWAEKLGAGIVRSHAKADPAAVVFDTVSAAQARNVDVAIIDTAGRLHTKAHLMQELEKMRRSCHKVIPGAPHETFLVLDATTGQNAIDQAKTFHQYTPITGLILTKLDGTAKGGIAIAITRELKIPIKFIGVGEDLDDLELFKAKNFVEALFI